MSSLRTSATRRSRRVFDAVSTAFLAASSHDVLLVPMISVTRYTPPEAFLAMRVLPRRQDKWRSPPRASLRPARRLGSLFPAQTQKKHQNKTHTNKETPKANREQRGNKEKKKPKADKKAA